MNIAVYNLPPACPYAGVGAAQVRMAISTDEFRQTLGHFATGVTVITVNRGQGEVHGMTGNAFTSVSLVPPLVLVCVDLNACTHPLLKEERRFGINVLEEQQEALACYFADAHQSHESAAHEAGDHTIFVGQGE